MTEWDGNLEDQWDALRAQYQQDPAGTDMAVIAAVAQQTRDELAATLSSAHYNDVAAAQYDISAAQAVRNVRERFSDYDKIAPAVVEKLQSNPHLLPNTMMPGELEAALVDVVKLVGLEQGERDAEAYAERIQNADLRRYR